jgi:hypothetical protein
MADSGRRNFYAKGRYDGVVELSRRRFASPRFVKKLQGKTLSKAA